MEKCLGFIHSGTMESCCESLNLLRQFSLFYVKSTIKWHSCIFIIISARLWYFGCFSNTAEVSGLPLLQIISDCFLNPIGMTDIYLGVINSAVHIFMYTYYLLSSVNSTKRLMKKVKPFVTILQLIQFLVITGHCLVAIQPSCDATRLFYIQFPNVFLLMYMFVKFFIQTYVNRNKKKA